MYAEVVLRFNVCEIYVYSVVLVDKRDFSLSDKTTIELSSEIDGVGETDQADGVHFAQYIIKEWNLLPQDLTIITNLA